MDITRLLIANRGEIAVRIARTAHRLGISTVGVYSEPDANALHVDSVDVAVALGGATPAESYLRGDAIIAAALATGADAIHPGYGFLAENAAFAQAVIDAGLVWVGPTPEQVTLLGDKVAAKRAALDAGVPTTSMIEVVDGRVADGANVTYPALVKAAAGGGGRGMRIVRSADELDDAVAAASREALSAFGDGSVFIEPYLERGRHVEVQVFGDQHGNVVHLGERECSIQRRNQKIVEESPSAGISAGVRAALCDGAVALARHVGYEGAGTVEFMVGADADGEATITFLEVNTRLQVEHPVTEAVTGLDLVELQLCVAAGEPLPVTQGDITVTGHAIEVRVVAEDPAAGWMPSTGRIGRFSIGDGVRVDTGVRDGAEISSDYDSLVAKVISHAPTRVEAARQLARALRGSQITGIRTNVDSLVAILGEGDYLAAATPTAYLDEHPDVLTPIGPAGDDRVALLLGAVFALEAERRVADRATPFAPSGWRNLRTQGQRQVWLEPTGEHLHVEYVMRPERLADGSTRWNASAWLGPWPEPDNEGVLPPDERVERHIRLLDRRVDGAAVEVDGRRYSVGTEVVHHGLGLDDDGVGAVTVHTRSTAGALTLTRAPRFALHDAQAEGGGPICPLPGTVIAVHVAAGDSVSDGQVLMVVEAMKMEHKIVAPADAVVSEVRFAVGDRVDQGDLLVALDHGDPTEDPS
jgi:propionyl-CoA carboxylase alpha chain